MEKSVEYHVLSGGGYPDFRRYQRCEPTGRWKTILEFDITLLYIEVRVFKVKGTPEYEEMPRSFIRRFLHLKPKRKMINVTYSKVFDKPIWVKDEHFKYTESYVNECNKEKRL